MTEQDTEIAFLPLGWQAPGEEVVDLFNRCCTKRAGCTPPPQPGSWAIRSLLGTLTPSVSPFCSCTFFFKNYLSVVHGNKGRGSMGVRLLRAPVWHFPLLNSLPRSGRGSQASENRMFPLCITADLDFSLKQASPDLPHPIAWPLWTLPQHEKSLLGNIRIVTIVHCIYGFFN